MPSDVAVMFAGVLSLPRFFPGSSFSKQRCSFVFVKSHSLYLIDGKHWVLLVQFSVA